MKAENMGLYADAVNLARKLGRVSPTVLQRGLRIGYADARRLVDEMEDVGVAVRVPPGDPGPAGVRTPPWRLAKEVVAVAFEDGRPFSVVTLDADGCAAIYDVDWCRRDRTLYYHCAGYSAYVEGYGPYWMRDGRGVDPPDRSRERLEEIDAKWLDPEMPWGEESDTEWCDVCQDRLPVGYDIVGDDAPCPHLVWEDGNGWLSAAEAAERKANR
jgi:hypothetical protein